MFEEQVGVKGRRRGMSPEMSKEKPAELGAEPGMLTVLLHHSVPGWGLGWEGAPLSALQTGGKK